MLILCLFGNAAYSSKGTYLISRWNVQQFTERSDFFSWALKCCGDLVQGSRKDLKSGGRVVGNMVGIICPLLWNRVNWSAKIWGRTSLPPTGSYGSRVDVEKPPLKATSIIRKRNWNLCLPANHKTVNGKS